jgi:vancomycin resistance protein YoaR
MFDASELDGTSKRPAEMATTTSSETPRANHPPELRPSRRPSRARSRSGTGIDRQAVLLVGAAIAGVLLMVSFGDVAASWGRVHPGVSIGNVAVSSLAPAEARAKVVEAFLETSATPVTAVSGTSRWKVTARSLKLTVDATASVKAAMAVGRTGGLWTMIADRVSAIFGGVSVSPAMLGDTAKITALLDRIDAVVAEPSRDASVAVNGTTVTFISSHTGRALDRSATRQAVLGAFLSASHTAAVRVVRAGVQVSNADAQQAYRNARKLVAGPVTVTYATRLVNVSRETVATWVRFDLKAAVTSADSTTASATAGQDTSSSVNPARMILVASFEATRVAKAISKLTKGLGQSARDAGFVIANGKVRITASRAGRGPDLTALATDLTNACVNGSSRKASVRLTAIQPSVTTAAARKMGIVGRISTFTTHYSSGATSRVHNVHLLAAALNNTLIAPGDVFSFNGTAGKRTAAKGYEEAPAIVEGKLVQQLGGGVCQVGTTVFNAVFFSGLPVVERHNHSFYISHYPTGRDATVSWGGPDLKFKNDTDHWILIRTSTTAGSLTVSLYGTDPGYKVKYTTSKLLDVVAFKVTKTKDDTLAKGKSVIEDPGVNGCRVVVVRTVYKSGKVVRTDTFVSHYSAKEEVVRVGTKVSKTATETATP